MRITRSLFLLVFGGCSAFLLHEVPAHAQAPGGSTSYRPNASTAARPLSSSITAKRQAAPKSSLSRVPRPTLKSPSGVASKSQQSQSFSPDQPFADNSAGLFDPRPRGNAASLAAATRHQYHADPRSGVYANKSIPQIRSRGRGGMGRMGGMGMGGMGMGGMGGMR